MKSSLKDRRLLTQMIQENVDRSLVVDDNFDGELCVHMNKPFIYTFREKLDIVSPTMVEDIRSKFEPIRPLVPFVNHAAQVLKELPKLNMKVKVDCGGMPYYANAAFMKHWLLFATNNLKTGNTLPERAICKWFSFYHTVKKMHGDKLSQVNNQFAISYMILDGVLYCAYSTGTEPFHEKDRHKITNITVDNLIPLFDKYIKNIKDANRQSNNEIDGLIEFIRQLDNGKFRSILLSRPKIRDAFRKCRDKMNAKSVK